MRLKSMSIAGENVNAYRLNSCDRITDSTSYFQLETVTHIQYHIHWTPLCCIQSVWSLSVSVSGLTTQGIFLKARLTFCQIYPKLCWLTQDLFTRGMLVPKNVFGHKFSQFTKERQIYESPWRWTLRRGMSYFFLIFCSMASYIPCVYR